MARNDELTRKQWDKTLDKAAALGRKAGRNAAEWYIQDTIGGRVTRGEEETALRLLQGIEDGDPEILDSLPFHSLTEREVEDLLDELNVEVSLVERENLVTTWEMAAQDAAVDAVAAAARKVASKELQQRRFSQLRSRR